MTEPDEATLWARENAAKQCDRDREPRIAAAYRQGQYDDDHLKADAEAYRAGQAASAERIKALEEALERIDGLFGDAVQFDCENGVRSLNEAASARYLADAPETKAAIHESLEIIRALLKEADQ